VIDALFEHATRLFLGAAVIVLLLTPFGLLMLAVMLNSAWVWVPLAVLALAVPAYAIGSTL
jgi:hypothetical protein